VVGKRSERIPAGPWVCSAKAYDKIIEAVGTRPANRDDLILDLYTARSKLLTFVALDSNAGARAREKLFSAIADSAVTFREGLLDERGDWYAARAIALKFPGDFKTFLAALDCVIDAAQDLKEENSSGAWVRLRHSPADWFAGAVLRDVFERNFGQKASLRIKRDGRICGAYVKFAVAVMDAMGIRTVSSHTVVRAFKDVRAGHTRRRDRSTTVTASVARSGKSL